MYVLEHLFIPHQVIALLSLSLLLLLLSALCALYAIDLFASKYGHHKKQFECVYLLLHQQVKYMYKLQQIVVDDVFKDG